MALKFVIDVDEKIDNAHLDYLKANVVKRADPIVVGQLMLVILYKSRELSAHGEHIFDF